MLRWWDNTQCNLTLTLPEVKAFWLVVSYFLLRYSPGLFVEALCWAPSASFSRVLLFATGLEQELNPLDFLSKEFVERFPLPSRVPPVMLRITPWTFCSNSLFSKHIFFLANRPFAIPLRCGIAEYQNIIFTGRLWDFDIMILFWYYQIIVDISDFDIIMILLWYHPIKFTLRFWDNILILSWYYLSIIKWTKKV